MKKIALVIAVLVMLMLATSSAFAEQNEVTPSTNEINKTNGWAHVDLVSTGLGNVTLNFVSTRAFYSCFEYRTDGDTTQILTENGGVNYNANVTDGLYPYFCVKNNNKNETIYAYEYVEVRMVFGAETDERFDWTRFDVLPVPTDKEQCKDGGWIELYGPDGLFNNQGQCIQFVLTEK